MFINIAFELYTTNIYNISFYHFNQSFIFIFLYISMLLHNFFHPHYLYILLILLIELVSQVYSISTQKNSFYSQFKLNFIF